MAAAPIGRLGNKACQVRAINRNKGSYPGPAKRPNKPPPTKEYNKTPSLKPGLGVFMQQPGLQLTYKNFFSFPQGQ